LWLLEARVVRSRSEVKANLPQFIVSSPATEETLSVVEEICATIMDIIRLEQE
jgi:hypothetical protein